MALSSPRGNLKNILKPGPHSQGLLFSRPGGLVQGICSLMSPGDFSGWLVGTAV